jgi:dynein heavy chain
VIGESNFLAKIKAYDKDNVSAALIAKIKKFILLPDFTADEVRKVSTAAAALCTWVHAIYIYANVAKEVAPKRARLKEAMDGLASKQAALKLATEALAEVVDKVNKLKQR